MPFQWSVVVGFVPWDCSGDLEKTYPVLKISINEDSGSNVAIVELLYGPEMSNYINVVTFNMFNYDFPPGTQCTVVGWNPGNGSCECLEPQLLHINHH